MAISSNPTISVGSVMVGYGNKSSLNITANTVVKAQKGRCARVVVIVAGSGAGTLHDAATVAAAATANEIFAIPTTAGSYEIDFPCANGIVVKPGTGQTIAVSYI